MSRIGLKAISIPSGIKVNATQTAVTVEGPKGKLEIKLHPRVKVSIKDGQISVARSKDERLDKALHGFTRSTIQNMISGVTTGYEKNLAIEGVGFKAAVQGKTLQLALGFSHPINYVIPEGVKVEAAKPTQISVKGIDKALVGQVAADIRRFFEPEPYKGKGIRYVGEHVRKKQGKTVG